MDFGQYLSLFNLMKARFIYRKLSSHWKWLIDMKTLNATTLVQFYSGLYISVETTSISLNSADFWAKKNPRFLRTMNIDELDWRIRKKMITQYLTASFDELTIDIYIPSKVQALVKMASRCCDLPGNLASKCCDLPGN